MNRNAPENSGVIGRIVEDGFPVIYSFESDLPPPPIIQSLSLLTVVSWQYDGSSNNGMPPTDVNEQMVDLEDAIEDHQWRGSLYRAYGRTGNGLKELVYYIASQEAFLEGINAALAGRPRFPIKITFYPDAAWDDLKRVQADFAAKV